MTEALKTSKYRYLSDPPVLSKPFFITVDEDRCIGCGVCIMQCPCQTIEMVKRAEPSAKQDPSCRFACPAGVDIRGYLGVLRDGGSMEDAWRLLTRDNPFPAITGRVCPHPCESSCNRGCLDEAVNINCIERSVGDYGVEHGLCFEGPKNRKEEKIAVVGAGPSGLSCAYHLAMMGFRVSVFEAADKPGGMLSHAIPRYRLPREVIEAEMKRVTDLAAEVRYGTVIGSDVTLEELAQEFKAVYVAVGARKSAALRIKGEQASNVIAGLDFLRHFSEKTIPALGKKVVVVGGGNTAVDAARAARRLGCEVTMLYRRTSSEMPAYAAETGEALREGVRIEYLCAPVKLVLDGSNRASSVVCTKMELSEKDESGRPRPVPVRGSEFSVSMDSLIVAIGQELDPDLVDGIRSETGWIGVDGSGATGLKGVFAGGDAAAGPGTVSQAIGDGRKAALAIDAFLSGRKLAIPEKKEISFKDIPLNGRPRVARNHADPLDVRARLADPAAEVNRGLSVDAVKAEQGRCLGCGMEKPEFTGIQYFGKICIACHNCEAVCSQEALSFPSFYQVTEGRWAYSFDYPQAPGSGMPNPLMKDRPAPFESIRSELTGVEQTIYTRRSTRVYKPDPVPRELIQRVLEAGRFAPSAGNCQGWKFVVVTDREILNGLSQATTRFLGIFTKLYQGKGPLRSSLKKSLAFIKPNSIDQRPMVAIQALITPKFGEGRLDAFFNAPAAIFLLTHRLHISDPSLGMGICAQNMVLAAHSLGLGTCYVGFVSNALNMDPSTRKKFLKKLGVAWPYDTVATVITLGYPAVKLDRPVDREFPKVHWVE
jgi:NADPH-dependent glutamate synthase beta subunit-like oxidoreductase/nitroreductase